MSGMTSGEILHVGNVDLLHQGHSQADESLVAGATTLAGWPVSFRLKFSVLT